MISLFGTVNHLVLTLNSASSYFFQRNAMTKVSPIPNTTQASSKSLLPSGSCHRCITNPPIETNWPSSETAKDGGQYREAARVVRSRINYATDCALRFWDKETF
jgi:hypothetical protein